MNTYETKKNADEIDSLDKHLINPRLPFKKAKDILGNYYYHQILVIIQLLGGVSENVTFDQCYFIIPKYVSKAF